MKKMTIFSLLLFCLAFSGCGEEHLRADTPVTFSFEEVSVHDPAVIDGEDGYYYIFGSHLAAAKSADLMNWSYVNQGVKNENSVIPDVLKQMKDAFAWSHSNTFWAPDPVRLRGGKYAMYYCNCKGDEPLPSLLRLWRRKAAVCASPCPRAAC